MTDRRDVLSSSGRYLHPIESLSTESQSETGPTPPPFDVESADSGDALTVPLPLSLQALRTSGKRERRLSAPPKSYRGLASPSDETSTSQSHADLVVAQGWLQKLHGSKARQHYQRRYFTLKGDVLSWRDTRSRAASGAVDDEGTDSGTDASGSTSMVAVRMVLQIDDMVKVRLLHDSAPYEFGVMVPGHKKMYLRTDSWDELAKWFRGFSLCGARVSPKSLAATAAERDSYTAKIDALLMQTHLVSDKQVGALDLAVDKASSAERMRKSASASGGRKTDVQKSSSGSSGANRSLMRGGSGGAAAAVGGGGGGSSREKARRSFSARKQEGLAAVAQSGGHMKRGVSVDVPNSNSLAVDLDDLRLERSRSHDSAAARPAITRDQRDRAHRHSLVEVKDTGRLSELSDQELRAMGLNPDTVRSKGGSSPRAPKSPRGTADTAGAAHRHGSEERHAKRSSYRRRSSAREEPLRRPSMEEKHDTLWAARTQARLRQEAAAAAPFSEAVPLLAPDLNGAPNRKLQRATTDYISLVGRGRRPASSAWRQLQAAGTGGLVQSHTVGGAPSPRSFSSTSPRISIAQQAKQAQRTSWSGADRSEQSMQYGDGGGVRHHTADADLDDGAGALNKSQRRLTQLVSEIDSLRRKIRAQPDNDLLIVELHRAEDELRRLTLLVAGTPRDAAPSASTHSPTADASTSTKSASAAASRRDRRRSGPAVPRAAPVVDAANGGGVSCALCQQRQGATPVSVHGRDVIVCPICLNELIEMERSAAYVEQRLSPSSSPQRRFVCELCLHAPATIETIRNGHKIFVCGACLSRGHAPEKNESKRASVYVPVIDRAKAVLWTDGTTPKTIIKSLTPWLAKRGLLVRLSRCTMTWRRASNDHVPLPLGMPLSESGVCDGAKLVLLVGA